MLVFRYMSIYIIWCFNVSIDLRTINRIREALYTLTEIALLINWLTVRYVMSSSCMKYIAFLIIAYTVHLHTLHYYTVIKIKFTNFH